MEEVVGSIPTRSTIFPAVSATVQPLLFSRVGRMRSFLVGST